jgi:hypothetical protein
MDKPEESCILPLALGAESRSSGRRRVFTNINQSGKDDDRTSWTTIRTHISQEIRIKIRAAAMKAGAEEAAVIAGVAADAAATGEAAAEKEGTATTGRVHPRS